MLKVEELIAGRVYQHVSKTRVEPCTDALHERYFGKCTKNVYVGIAKKKSAVRSLGKCTKNVYVNKSEKRSLGSLEKIARLAREIMYV